MSLERGDKDILECHRGRGHHVRRARGEVHHPSITGDSKEVIVVGNDPAAIIAVVVHLRPGGGGVARDQRAGQGDVGVVIQAATARGGIA
jgi:hypothetical protein